MKDMVSDGFLKDIPAELMEKAKACRNIDELLKLADENDIELPNEVLESVSGGGCEDYFEFSLPPEDPAS